MRRSRWFTVACLTLACTAHAGGAAQDTASPPAPADAALRDQVRRILRSTPLVDGHNDLPWQIRDRFKGRLDDIDLTDTSRLDPPLQTDVARLRTGLVGAQFWSVYVPVESAGAAAVQAVLEQIDLVGRMVEGHSSDLELARTADDVVRIHRAGKVASLVGVEGGHCIGNSLAVLRQLHACGARYLTLAHAENTPWVDSATEYPEHGGLAPFGVEVVHEMNRLGMLVDLSHVSAGAMHAVLDVARAPVVFSHSSARGVCDVPRNVPDDVLARLPANGGVVMVCFAPRFVSTEVLLHDAAQEAETARLRFLHPGDSLAVVDGVRQWQESHPAPRATLAQVADHVDRIRAVAGTDHVGIGSDFDGIRTTPLGLEDVSCFPELLVELLRRGYSADDVRKVAGLNLLRVLRQAEQAARGFQQK